MKNGRRRAWLFDLREAILAMHYFGVTFALGLIGAILIVTFGVLFDFLCLSVFLSILLLTSIALTVLWAFGDYKKYRP